MLSFQEQQKILKPILERETNKHCADCGSHTPTWASLDFGVFVCSNCSGAHRALGPTITRIKSTKLDQWYGDWVENMRIGNLEINQYWEADSKTATVKKPRSGATLDEHNRYVYDKYVRRKFIFDKSAIDPLKAYKSGKTNNHHYHSVDIVQQHSVEKPKNHNTYKSELPMPAILGFSNKISETVAKKENYSLLDDDNQVQDQKHRNKSSEPNHSHIAHHGSHAHNGKVAVEEDQFTEYIEPINNNPVQVSHPASSPAQDPSKLSFDELFKQPQLTTTQSVPQTLPSYTHQQQNVIGQAQWNPYSQQPVHNYGGYNNYGQAYNQQSHYVNQFAHNPYIGYAPHNNLHASYNMNFNGY